MAFPEYSKLSLHSHIDSTKRSTSTPLCSSINDSGYHSHFAQTPFLKPNYRQIAVTPADESPLPPSSLSTSADLSDSLVQVLFEDDEECKTEGSSTCGSATEISYNFLNQSSMSEVQDSLTIFHAPCIQANWPSKAVIHTPKGLPSGKYTSLSGWCPGQEIGERHIDFFKELGHYRSCLDIVLHVCSYLSPKDLVHVGQVCHVWRKFIEHSSELRLKRESFLSGRRFCGPGFGKENQHASGKPRPKGPRMFGLQLTDIANQVQVSTPHSPAKLETPRSTSRLPQFQEQAKKLLACEHLQPCPRCQFPSRVTPGEKRAHCTSTQCSFDYCTQCRANFHAPKPCKKSLLAGTHLKSPNKRDLIGHKGARRNLKRL